MAETMTPAGASQILQAIKVLEVLEANGTISSGEQAALDRARAKQKPAEQAALETRATYGGFTAGAMMNLNDEARGAYNFANELYKSRDLEGAKKAYAKYRDLQRQIDEALQTVAPEQYASGQTAGAVTSMVAPGGVAFKAGSKLPVLGQIATSSGVGAAATALPQFAGGEDGFTARLSEVDPLTTAVGGTLGAVAPVAGRMVGAVTRGAQNLARKGVDGYGGAASRRVASTLSGPQATGQDIQSYLDSLGPEAMLADVPGRPRTMAQGLATIPGEGQEVLTREIGARGAGAGQRIEDVMTQRVGRADAAFNERVSQAEAKSGVFGPMYEAALQSGKSFDVSDIRAAIDGQMSEAASNVRSGLKTVLRDLDGSGEISATKLHNARAALSDAAQSARIAGQGNKARELGDALSLIDSRLDTLDGYAAARTGYANSSAISRAVDSGRKVFTSGAITGMSPEDVGQILKAMSPAERDGFKKGAREYIAALMGTSRNSAASAWQKLTTEFNDKKMSLIIGEADAKVVAQRLMAESEFAKTSSDVLAGSQTGFRSEAAAGLRDLRDPDSLAAPSVGQRVKAGLAAPVNRIMDEVMYGTGNIRREIGEILTLQGSERDAVVAQLLGEASKLQDKTKLQNLTNMLTQVGLMASTPKITGE